MSQRAHVQIDDWLVVYTFDLDGDPGHSSVRYTEYWPEWSKVGEGEVTDSELAAATQRVIERAHELGPEEHDCARSNTGRLLRGGWCAKCATYQDDPNEQFYGLGGYEGAGGG